MAITGNEWKRLPDTAQRVYVIGVVDTWNNLAQIIEATEKPSRSEVLGPFTDFTRCLRKGITYGQITAIVQKYMENNPSQWHHDMASLTWNAVNEACAQQASNSGKEKTETQMEQNKKCPTCGKGTMKAVSNSVPVFADVPREKEMQAACDQCGYQDDLIKFYPLLES